MKVYVTYSLSWTKCLKIESIDDLEKQLEEIKTPESEDSTYVDDSFQIISIEDMNGRECLKTGKRGL